MKRKIKFIIFAIIFAALLGASIYGVAFVNDVADSIKEGTYSGTFWSETRAAAAAWIFIAAAALSAVGMVFGIIKSKAVYVVFIALFAALLAISSYLGFEHLKSMPFNVTGENVVKLIIFIALIILSLIGIIVNALGLTKRPDV